MYKVGDKVDIKLDFTAEILEFAPDGKYAFKVGLQSNLEDNSYFTARVDENTLDNPVAAYLMGLIARYKLEIDKSNGC